MRVGIWWSKLKVHAYAQRQQREEEVAILQHQLAAVTNELMKLREEVQLLQMGEGISWASLEAKKRLALLEQAGVQAQSRKDTIAASHALGVRLLKHIMGRNILSDPSVTQI